TNFPPIDAFYERYRRVFDNSERLLFGALAHKECGDSRDGVRHVGHRYFHPASENVGLAAVVAESLESRIAHRKTGHTRAQRIDTTIGNNDAELLYSMYFFQFL